MMDEGSCSLTGDITSQGVRSPKPINLTHVAMDVRVEGLERLQLGHRIRKHVLAEACFIHPLRHMGKNAGKGWGP